MLETAVSVGCWDGDWGWGEKPEMRLNSLMSRRQMMDFGHYPESKGGRGGTLTNGVDRLYSK